MTIFEAYCTEIAAAARPASANIVEEAEVVIDIDIADTDVATIAASVLSGLLWRPGTPVGRGRNELRLLTSCTARRDDNKLKQFRIASIIPDQDVP